MGHFPRFTITKYSLILLNPPGIPPPGSSLELRPRSVSPDLRPRQPARSQLPETTRNLLPLTVPLSRLTCRPRASREVNTGTGFSSLRSSGSRTRAPASSGAQRARGAAPRRGPQVRPRSACARTPTCTAATCFRGQRLRTVHVRDPKSAGVFGRARDGLQRPASRPPLPTQRWRASSRVPRRCLFPPTGSPTVGCKPDPHTEGKDGLKREAGRSSSAVVGFLIEEFTRLVLAGSV